jgi:hypothetical protein
LPTQVYRPRQPGTQFQFNSLSRKLLSSVLVSIEIEIRKFCI